MGLEVEEGLWGQAAPVLPRPILVPPSPLLAPFLRRRGESSVELLEVWQVRSCWWFWLCFSSDAGQPCVCPPKLFRPAKEPARGQQRQQQQQEEAVEPGR